MTGAYYITFPKSKERCITVLRALLGNEKLPVFEESNWKFVSADAGGIYFTERLSISGVRIEETPTIEKGQTVIHFRSGREEVIEGEALLKTSEGWKDCVIYKNKEGMVFVREKKDFIKSFVNKK